MEDFKNWLKSRGEGKVEIKVDIDTGIAWAGFWIGLAWCIVAGKIVL